MGNANRRAPRGDGDGAPFRPPPMHRPRPRREASRPRGHRAAPHPRGRSRGGTGPAGVIRARLAITDMEAAYTDAAGRTMPNATESAALRGGGRTRLFHARGPLDPRATRRGRPRAHRAGPRAGGRQHLAARPGDRVPRSHQRRGARPALLSARRGPARRHHRLPPRPGRGPGDLRLERSGRPARRPARLRAGGRDHRPGPTGPAPRSPRSSRACREGGAPRLASPDPARLAVRPREAARVRGSTSTETRTASG